jgi:hypothetical protein
MAIGVNWKEIWGPVWKAVWTNVAPEPPPPPPPAAEITGGGGIPHDKKRRYGLIPPKTREELAALVKAQREALGILPKPAQKRVVAAVKKAASKPEPSLQPLAPLVVDLAVSEELPAVDVARAVEQSFAYAVALQQAKATIDAGIRQQAEQERQANFEAARQEHLARLRAEDENVLAFMESLRNEAIQAIRATQQQLKELLSSGIAAPE